MSKKSISQRKRLTAVFVSFTVLIIGTLSLVESQTLDYYSVLGTLEKLIPASIVFGGLGWIMGMILDKPKKVQRIDYNTLFQNPKKDLQIEKLLESVEEKEP